MSITVVAQPLVYPVDLIAPPQDTNSFIAACAQYTLYFLPADYRFAATGYGAPGLSNIDKVWFASSLKTGQPEGAYFKFNGIWRLLYSGLPFELRYIFGDPSPYFDSTGLGIVGNRWDGWALCNGQNGTQDLRDKFAFSGNNALSAFQWYTTLINPVPLTTGGTTTTPPQSAGATAAGSSSIVLQTYNLPAINCSIPLTNGVKGDTRYFAMSVPYGGPSPGGPVGETFVNAQNTGGSPNIGIVPPYTAVGIAMFVGYFD